MFYYFEVFLLLFAKNREIRAPVSYLDVVVCTPKNIYEDGIRDPLGFATGLLFPTNSRNDGDSCKNTDLEGHFVPVYTQ